MHGLPHYMYVLMHILNNEADMEEKYAQLKSKLKI